MLQRKIATPEKPEGPKPPSRGPIETITSPYDRFTPRQGYPDTPALRQLRYLSNRFLYRETWMDFDYLRIVSIQFKAFVAFQVGNIRLTAIRLSFVRNIWNF
jgi:hypothetical protein